ncbi:allergin-1 [Calypte anna]|uniref:allergin-1 n=1 Tax=Calypte anna TaxID=9244 RepID=UPI0011C389DB|nr:allergin-1 [Calypte anna]
MFFLTTLLFSYFQMSQQNQQTTSNGKGMLSNPRLIPVQGTLNVEMNQNVTLSCLSDSGSPPVTYTLFKHNQKVSALTKPDLTPALFNLTITSASDVGEYKCKAENNNSSGGKYSRSLNFTLHLNFTTEPVSKPVLSSPTFQARKGQNVTLSCFSENGSLPITYVFFKGKQNISPPVKMEKREAAVIFLFINSSSDFGTYKCKAQNSFQNNTKYSNSFNFTLAEERHPYQPLVISSVLLLLLLAVGFALAIRFFIIPSYKARRFKSTRPSSGLTSAVNAEDSENDVIYTEIDPVTPEEEYINISVIRGENEKAEKRAATVYSKVLIRD